MLKKLFSIILVIILVAAVLVAFNAEALCKKYIYPEKYAVYVEKYSEQNNIDKYFVYAIIKTESNFKCDAESEVGARGLMQIMEDAYDWVGYRMNDSRGLSYNDMYEPEYNIEYGSYLISMLYEEYGDKETALAAYFMGRGKVNEWLKNKEYSDDGRTLKKIPSSSAQHYVNKVMTAYNGYLNLYNE